MHVLSGSLSTQCLDGKTVIDERAEILHGQRPGQKAIWLFFAQLLGVSKKCDKRRRKSGYFPNLAILLDRYRRLVHTFSPYKGDMRIYRKNGAGS